MKILLTGSSGFIGTHFRNKSGFRNIICCDKQDNDWVHDIDAEDLRRVKTIIHLAAYISGPESWNMPAIYFENNVMETLHLVRTAIVAGVKRIIFTSSAAVYGNPLTPYGASKLSAESALECYKDKIEIVVLRLFNVYGEGQNESYAGVINKFKQCMAEGKPITIYGKGDSVRDYVYVDDVVKTLVKACKTNDKGWFEKPIQVGTGYGISVVKLAKILAKINKVKSLKINYERTLREISRSVAKPDKKLLDWRFTDLKKGLALF